MHPSPQFILIRLYQVHQTHFLNLGDLSTFNWNSIIHLSYNVSELVPTKPHHFSALQCCLKKEKQKTRGKKKTLVLMFRLSHHSIKFDK